MTRKQHIVVVVITGLFSAVISVAALANDPEDTLPPGSDLAQIVTIEPSAQEALEVLEEARTPTDAMPVAVAAELDEGAEFGLNPDLSRMSIGNVSGSVYVIPANDHVCVSLAMGEGASLSCIDTDLVKSGEVGPMTQGLEGGGVGIFGIVPDGVESVTVETSDFGSQQIDVENNAYYVAYAVATAVRTLRYTGPSGEVEYPLADPSAVFE